LSEYFFRSFGSDVAVLIIGYVCVEKFSVLSHVLVTEGRTGYGKDNVWGTCRSISKTVAVWDLWHRSP
jgi:hypothetical protein